MATSGQRPTARRSAIAKRTVRLGVVCQVPLPGSYQGEAAEFGIQDKDQRVHPGHAQADGSIRYEVDATVSERPGTMEPRFGGSFVHGSATGPFLYLSWRPGRPEGAPWIRRLKIPLASIDWVLLGGTDTGEAVALEATISGEGSGTVALLGEGWTSLRGENPA